MYVYFVGEGGVLFLKVYEMFFVYNVLEYFEKVLIICYQLNLCLRKVGYE